jgi:hypothetical protein
LVVHECDFVVGPDDGLKASTALYQPEVDGLPERPCIDSDLEAGKHGNPLAKFGDIAPHFPVRGSGHPLHCHRIRDKRGHD